MLATYTRPVFIIRRLASPRMSTVAAVVGMDKPTVPSCDVSVAIPTNKKLPGLCN